MVVTLGPGKFYGSGLPRPRFYTDVKFAPERVDPPAPVMDALLSWADEAHWSMGGFNTKRLRLQGRIEGSVKKLCAQRRRSDKAKKSKTRPEDEKIRKIDEVEWQESESEPEPEPEVVVPAAGKLGRMTLRKRARKLVDEFEEVAEDADQVGLRMRNKKPKSESDKVAQGSGPHQSRRASPRKSAAAAEVSGAEGGRRTSPRKSAA